MDGIGISDRNHKYNERVYEEYTDRMRDHIERSGIKHLKYP